MIEHLTAAAIIAVLAICGGVAASRKRKRQSEPGRPTPGVGEKRYEIRPFPPYGDLFTIEEFQECFTRWHMTDGTSHWANTEGEWFDRTTNQYVRADPHEIRAGKIPEPFFTHIKYYGK